MLPRSHHMLRMENRCVGEASWLQQLHAQSPGGLSTPCSRHRSLPAWCAVIFHWEAQGFHGAIEAQDYHLTLSLPEAMTPLNSFHFFQKSLPSADPHDLTQFCPTATCNWKLPCRNLLGCSIRFLLKLLHFIGFSKFFLLFFGQTPQYQGLRRCIQL